MIVACIVGNGRVKKFQKDFEKNLTFTPFTMRKSREKDYKNLAKPYRKKKFFSFVGLGFGLIGFFVNQAAGPEINKRLGTCRGSQPLF